ncbi:amidohydrolase family protein [Flectobacillus roseus]|uniref:Amidohydrolase family protein n=1 Tax=Flectobacillus roseus TaxID=502259 RepID=A0ABT6Y864_9BACT|nr:amidohydrolase family protein [Flectobacillus roseus]MDI9859772.1 amidohydrolase family protein [Flectobacillus roseus]
MKKILYTFINIIMFGTVLRAQTTTFPRNGVQDERPNTYAFVNATIVSDANTVLEGATLVIKGSVIEAVGKNITLPAGTQVIDLKGKRIYPSLVEAYSSYGMPELKREGRSFRGDPQFESKKQGAYNWNQAVLPEVNAAAIYASNPTAADELRKAGFGAAITHVQDGIVRGTSALVALIDGRDQEALLKTNVSAHYSLSKGSSTQDYPNSLMGSVALLRQTYLDADWYKKSKNHTEYNISLESFNNSQSVPQVFEVSDKLGILRANKIGKEFGVNYIIKGGGDEYQRLDEVKAAGVSLIIPLNFPTTPDVEDPFDASVVSLSDMKHWEMAPANPAILAKAGVPFAITTSNVRSKSDFWANLRKAVEYGLDEKVALAALTSVPAQFNKVDNLVGSLKPGMLANFLITSDNLFKESNVIYENWVKGKRYVVNNMNITDMRATYDLSVAGKSGLKLNVTGKVDKPEFQIQVSDSVKVSPKVTRTGDLLTLSFKLDAKKDKGDTRISAYYDGKNIKGDGFDAAGTPVKFDAIFKEAFKEAVAKADTTKKPVPTIGKIVYPFNGYGAETKPKAETLLIKNATVWTNEKDGILKNTDVLLKDGKIAQVGKNLSATGAKVVDGTGKHLTNGIFDEHSHIALLSVNEGSQSVTAEVRMEDVVNSEDVNIYRQLAGGVTSSQLLHGSANCIGGQSAIVKLKWGEAPEVMKIQNADGYIKFALGENVKQANWGDRARIRFPQTRMGVEQIMMDAFLRAKEYDKSWAEYNKAANKATLTPPRRDLELDALSEILNKKRFITCHSYVQSEINMLLKVADSLGFKVNTFTHILEGYKVADKMKAHGASGSTFADWWAYKMEVKEAIPFNAALMTKVGINTSINSDDAEMARRLNQEAAKTVMYGGLTEEEAWKLVTLNPAKMMHLDNRLGSIKAGKDADVVLWNENPLSVYAKPEKTIIEGAVYFDIEKDKELRANIAAERNRLIQKMLNSKASGAPTARPEMRKPRLFVCNSLGGLTEEEGETRAFGTLQLQDNCDK